MATGFAVSGIEGLRRNWGWVLALGVALIVLGIVALGARGAHHRGLGDFLWLAADCRRRAGDWYTASWQRAWSGFFLDLLTGRVVPGGRVR